MKYHYIGHSGSRVRFGESLVTLNYGPSQPEVKLIYRSTPTLRVDGLDQLPAAQHLLAFDEPILIETETFGRFQMLRNKHNELVIQRHPNLTDTRTGVKRAVFAIARSLGDQIAFPELARSIYPYNVNTYHAQGNVLEVDKIGFSKYRLKDARSMFRCLLYQTDSNKHRLAGLSRGFDAFARLERDGDDVVMEVLTDSLKVADSVLIEVIRELQHYARFDDPLNLEPDPTYMVPELLQSASFLPEDSSANDIIPMQHSFF